MHGYQGKTISACQTRRARPTVPLALVISVCGLSIAVLGTSADGQTMRVMPLGDSITVGVGDSASNGYRGPLYQSLTTAGLSVNFVGSQSSGNCADNNHEGHSGWRAEQIRDNIYNWLTSTPANIVLLHIGTNDISGGQTAAGVAAEVGQILDNINAWETATGTPVTVVLGRIVNRTDSKAAETSSYNLALQTLANTRAAAGDHVVVVNHESALSYPGDMADTVHPNVSGYNKMAAVWLPELTGLLGDDLLDELQLASTSGQDLTTDDLLCSYTLTGGATTAATAWYKNAAALMRLYLPMEGGSTNALLDYSGHACTITPSGNPVWLPTGGHDGHGAFEFDGNNELNAGENFPTASSYTKVAWVYRTGSGRNGGNNIISGNQDPNGHALWAPDTYSNKLSAGHNAVWNSVQDSVPLALNTWYHVALTYDTVSKQMVLYKNGSPVSNATVTAAVADTTISIGSFGYGNGWMWKGRIDDARVYAYALTPQQIASLYTAGQDVVVAAETEVGDQWQCKVTPFTGSEAGNTEASNVLAIAGDLGLEELQLTSASGQNLPTDDLTCSYTLTGDATTAASAWYRNTTPIMRLYLPMEGGTVAAARDYSGNNLALTPGSDPAWAATGGHDGRGAFEFDGNDDFNAGENFPTNSSYTKMAWVYRTGSGNNGGNNIVSGNDNSGGHALWAPDMYGNKLSAGHNGTWNSVQDTVALALNTWYHVALTYDSVTKQMVLYKNGNPINTATVTIAVTDPTISVGSFGASNGYMWKGSLDDVRVYTRALTPDQIASLYTVGQDVLKHTETATNETWQCKVTPFSATEAGATQSSNILTIAPNTPPVSNLLLSSTSGFNLTTDDLTCTYTLPGGAPTAATAWYRNAAALMRLYLPMEGGSTSALLDYSGNACTITPSGNPVWLPTGGHDGHGTFEFDGNNELNAGENFPTASSYTKVAWVYRTGSGRNGGNNIISGNQDPNGHALWAPDTYGNKLSAGHNAVWNSVQDSVPLALNTWYHVALTYDATSKQMILYKNGSPVSNATVTASVADTTISIGSFGYTNGWMWKGRIDDARVYAYVLTPQQIASLYTAGQDVLVAAETEVSDQYQCKVTPFTPSEAGPLSASNTLTIVSCQPPSITVQPSPKHACQGGQATFTVVATGTETLHYEWSVNDAPAGTDNATLLLENVRMEDNGAAIKCRVSNLCGNVTSETATLTVHPACPVDFDGDCDVDHVDVLIFVACTSGPTIPHNGQPTCQIADLDDDDDVDAADFGLFQLCYSGENQFADHCMR